MNLTAEQAKSMADMMLAGVELEAATTRKVIAAIPADKVDFKLGEKGWTAGKIAWHIARSEAWFAQAVVTGQFPEEEEPAPPASVAEVLAWWDANVPAATAKVRTVSGEDLAKNLNFYNVFNLPAVMYIDFWKSHAIHHRGYLAAYLRAMNAHVPSIYGGSADEPFQMPESAHASA